MIQIAQNIPLSRYNYTTGAGGGAPEELIERTATDAAVFLTVYPSQGFSVLTDDDFTALGNQILNCGLNEGYQAALRFSILICILLFTQGRKTTIAPSS